MKLQFLGQQTLGLVSGHAYQARWLVPGTAGDFPCPISDAKVNQVKDILGTLGSMVTPQFATSNWEIPAVLKLPNQTVFDQLRWPADRREVPPPTPQGTCPIWTQSVTTNDFNLPLAAVQNALAPLGGILLNFWDNTTGQRIYDRPAAQFVPGGGQVSPGQPPIVPGTPPVVQPPPPQTQPPATEEKKVSPLVWLLGGAVLIGAVVLVTR